MKKAASSSPGLAGMGILAILWAGLPVFAGGILLVFLEPLNAFLQENALLGWVVYVGAFIIGAGLGLVPTYAMAVLGGWVFGPVAGGLGALLGCTAASAVGYGISRGVSQASLAELFRRNAKAGALYEELVFSDPRRSTLLVAFLRLPPQFPFALTNLVMGAAAVPFRAFLAGTLAGMLPRTLLAVFFAAAGAATGAKNLADLVSSGPGRPALVLGLAVMLVSLTVVGWLGKSALHRLRRKGVTKAAP